MRDLPVNARGPGQGGFNRPFEQTKHKNENRMRLNIEHERKGGKDETVALIGEVNGHIVIFSFAFLSLTFPLHFIPFHFTLFLCCFVPRTTYAFCTDSHPHSFPAVTSTARRASSSYATVAWTNHALSVASRYHLDQKLSLIWDLACTSGSRIRSIEAALRKTFFNPGRPSRSSSSVSATRRWPC